MKKLFALILALVLCAVLCACGGETAEPEISEPSESEPTAEQEEPEEEPKLEMPNGKADIKYTKFVTNELAASPYYQYAAKDDNAVIIYVRQELNNDFTVFDRQVLTSPTPVLNFFEKTEKGEDAVLNVYVFYSDRDPTIWSYRYENGAFYEKTVHDDYWTEGALPWTDYDLTPLTSFTLSDFGCISAEDENSSEPNVTQVISNYDLFEDFDRMTELYKKYGRIIYMDLACSREFDKITEMRDVMCSVSTVARLENGKELWEDYPNGGVPLELVSEYMGKYFEFTEKQLKTALGSNLYPDGTVHWEGGYGGAYPEIFGFGFEDKGETSEIIFRHRDVITGDVDMGRYFLVTIKNMPDGSFRYVSLEEVEG